MFEEPDVSQTPTAIVGATPIGDSTNSVSSTSQTSIDLSWEDPAPSDIETTYCGVGTSAEENDIFPETPVRPPITILEPFLPKYHSINENYPNEVS